MKSSNDAVTDTVEFNKEKRRQVVVGLNAVTRSLERDKLRACLVCLSVKPAALNHHILMLSAITSCPTLALPNLSKTVAPLLGLNSILALGIKVSSCKFSLKVTFSCYRNSWMEKKTILVT